MQKLLAAVGTGVLFAGLGVAAASAEPAAAPSNATAISRADKALKAHLADVQGAAEDAYSVQRVISDQNGASHVRYARTHKGIPVLGGDFVIHTGVKGLYAGASSGLAAPIKVDTAAGLANGSAVSKARGAFAGKVSSAQSKRLVIDAQNGAPKLAWEVLVEGTELDGQSPSKLHVLVDADSGSVRGSWDDIQHATGTGHTVYSGTVPLDTTPVGAQFELKDPVRGNGSTCDMNNLAGACANMFDADNIWGNHLQSNRQSAAADAHYGAAKTFDYYRLIHGRNGIFGTGAGVPSRVHYGNGYANAFWDGTRMTYGDGTGNLKPLVSLDVAGHEMSHGVTQALSGLVYSGESGGLNESTSDIFGNMVEFYAANASDPGDYLVGEKIDIFGTGRPLRYMYNPILDTHSPNCWSAATAGLDPHYSSGVGNHFYFMLAEGAGATQYGTSPTCNGSTLTGIGRAKAQRIWYRALDVYFTSGTKYVDAANNDARYYTLQAASDLFGACSIEYRTVQKAWAAVNVTGADPTPCAAANWFTSDTNVAVPNPGIALSPISVVRPGNAPAGLKVAVNVKHLHRGQLAVHLQAPDGSLYLLKSAVPADLGDDVIVVYTVNAAAELATGSWKLRVQDTAAPTAGTIDGWSLLF
jgi:Zn-dependent metalloprotease